MKTQADKKRTERQFEVGEWVFLKLRPHRQLTLGARINPKLAPQYYRPFKVLARVEVMAYKLQLPETAKIHPIFHGSLLKKAVEDYGVEESLPSELACDDATSLEPKAV